MPTIYNFGRFILAKLITLIQGLFACLMAGVAVAAEIADAPIPEPNYTGIIIFAVAFFGGCGWFLWKIMSNKGDDKDKK